MDIRLSNSSQNGFSLVELMVAIALSLLLLTGVIKIFDSTKKTYHVQEGLSRIQENARFSFALLSKDIRMIGYAGCGNIKTLKIANIVKPPSAAAVFTEDDPIRGVNDITATTYGTIAAIPGTDVLIARSASPVSINLTGNLDTRNANIQLANNNLGLQADDILFITDCENADIFKANSVSQSAGKTTITHSMATNTVNFLSTLYESDAQILSFQSHTYFVGDTGRTDRNGNVITALFRQQVNGTVEELIEGVEDMQIVYGVNTDRDVQATADTYLAANAIGATQWRDVVSARISLLFNSVEDVDVVERSYTFLGVTTTSPGDWRLRKSYTTTIALRNRVP